MKNIRQLFISVRRHGLSAESLKGIAAVTMLIDHITFLVFERTVSPATGRALVYSSKLTSAADLAGRAIGRQAFPIFAFFIVEGFYHTSDRGRYLGRLTGFTLLSQVPYYLMCFTGPVGRYRTPGLNVCATLALGLLAVWIVDTVTGRSCSETAGILRISLAVAGAAACCGAALLLNTDYDAAGVIVILLFYLLRPYRAMAVSAVWVCLSCSNGAMELLSFPACFLLMQYNGKRESAESGTGRWRLLRSRYGFYLFYPVHMLVLWLIRFVLCGY